MSLSQMTLMHEAQMYVSKFRKQFVIPKLTESNKQTVTGPSARVQFSIWPMMVV